jgi:2-polyprenyl-6-methoxyphenol hydroxylase-like FAD-dependent oxidoreductase
MSLKTAALFALIGMILLTVLEAAGFLRDLTALLQGAMAAITLLASAIRFLASLGVTVFLFVFYRHQA